MILHDYLNKNQIELCKKVGIKIEEREYTSEDIYIVEHNLLEYINEHCADENFYAIEEKIDGILDILMDLENESDEINPMTIDIYEDDHVRLNNAKLGTVVDITNNVYTIEVDDEYKTGNIDDDIMIVAANSIIGKV